MNSANRVIQNTAILYIKIIITVGIALFTTRIVLDVLGAVDYGIFNLVAGIIIMLAFLKNAMATSTQRYLSFYQGKKDLAMQMKVFSNSFIFHFFLGLFVVVFLEIIGLFLFNGFLNIPENRIDAGKMVYHFMAVNVFFSILSIPFNGSLVAHENMLYISIVNIIEVLLKLTIALFLYYTVNDKLIIYGMLMAGISAVSFVVYAIYCLKKYPECQVKVLNRIDSSLMKELGAYAGWNLFGSICSLGRTQGLAVILNLFFGAYINAAYAIANQVGSQLSFLSSTMLKSINPQIMKSEGNGDRRRMLRLSMIASKFGFFLLSIIAVPFIFEMEGILNIWLKEVPDYTVIFCRMVLLAAMINQLTIGLQSAIQATGKIKTYQATVGGVLMLNLPLAFILLKIGFEAYSVLVGYTLIEFVACCLRIYFLNKTAGLSIREYMHRVIYKEIIPIITVLIACIISTTFFEFGFRFVLTIIMSVSGAVTAIYWSGLCEDEKDIILHSLHKAKNKILDRSQLISR